MGKIVKFCAKCEEGFAEKFGFCPNCGENLEAYEMNPVEQATAAAAAANTETLPPAKEAAAFTETETAETETIELDSVDVPEEKSYETQPAEAASPAYFYDEETRDDDYRPTVLEEKDVQLRNGLLLSLACLVISATMIAWVASIFVHSLDDVNALSDKDLFAFVGEIEDAPADIEEEKIKDKEGGGGGGGKERDTDASKGELPNQSRNPANVTPMEQRDFDLKWINNTTGPQTNRVLRMPSGLLNGADELSSGRGSGGGMGDYGKGNGLGDGEGDGEGPGKNGGRNGGNNGGANNDDEDGTPKLASGGVTSKVKIIAKQRAQYTDAARTNNIQGTVTLKVTFTAGGTIGAISTVSGLPYGLTDQAIAAARNIRFEPAMKNGRPVTTSMTVSFSFTIY